MKRTHSSHAAAHAGAESCIALIDARFLAWLQGQTDTAQDHVRPQLHQLLSNALAHNNLDLNVRRIYWYSDSSDDQAIGGQVSRAVLPHSQDGGLSMLRTLGADLKRLAERGACDHLLVGSDDERLISLIDEAQLHGVSVHLLADEASRNMTQLNREDPGWARLLSQADQRVVLGAQASRDGGSRHASSMHAVPQVDPEQLREQLNTVINTWWADEPEDLREELREELQNTRGIPQEVDRQLLLGVRRVLERALSFQEKKLLREMVRELVLGPQAAAAAPAVDHAE
ncbi:hypothetical protein C5F52_02020 [Limnohabitans sp. TS-CS-82]|uniref:hypothetical protein n=1 Tax=Limnohabitans sp. TS-CS-82 TaxID=2094193 RepID=UPI000CF21D1C|nr:hypothetical protein [Limnohabitans sp. TS-CS-82]PQA84800.1 hypothetical protein C5F52_02020 [Limnohabitans sp. TS-CS-82]